MIISVTAGILANMYSLSDLWTTAGLFLIKCRLLFLLYISKIADVVYYAIFSHLMHLKSAAQEQFCTNVTNAAHKCTNLANYFSYFPCIFKKSFFHSYVVYGSPERQADFFFAIFKMYLFIFCHDLFFSAMKTGTPFF